MAARTCTTISSKFLSTFPKKNKEKRKEVTVLRKIKSGPVDRSDFESNKK